MCVGPSPLCQHRSSSMIFVGDVVRLPGGEARVTVVDAIKGVTRGEELAFPGTGGTCDFVFESGTRMLLFADRAEGILQTSICSGNLKLSRARASDIRALRDSRARAEVRGALTMSNEVGGYAPLISVPISTTIDGKTYRARTGTDGKFVLRVPHGGGYTLDAALPDSLVLVPRYGVDPSDLPGRQKMHVDLEPGECKSLSMTAEKDARISGSLRASPGVPVEHVLVEAWPVGKGWWRQAYTDADGRFELYGLERGTYVVGTSLSTCGPAPTSPYARLFAPGVTERDLAKTFVVTDLERFDHVELPFAGRAPSRRVVLKTVGDNGAPMAGVLVTASSECGTREERKTGNAGTVDMELFEGRDWTTHIYDTLPSERRTDDFFAGFLRTLCPDRSDFRMPLPPTLEITFTAARCRERDNALEFARVEQQAPGTYVTVPVRTVWRGGGPTSSAFIEINSTTLNGSRRFSSLIRTDDTGRLDLPLRVGDSLHEIRARLTTECTSSALVIVDADGYRWSEALSYQQGADVRLSRPRGGDVELVFDPRACEDVSLPSGATNSNP